MTTPLSAICMIQTTPLGGRTVKTLHRTTTGIPRETTKTLQEIILKILPRNYQDSPGNYRESPRNYDDYERHPNHLTNGDDPLQTTNDPYSGDPSGIPPRNMYGNEEPPYNDYSPQREPPLMAPPPEGYNPELMRRSPSIGSHGRGKHVAMDTGRFALIFSCRGVFLDHCLDHWNYWQIHFVSIFGKYGQKNGFVALPPLVFVGVSLQDHLINMHESLDRNAVQGHQGHCPPRTRPYWPISLIFIIPCYIIPGSLHARHLANRPLNWPISCKSSE